VSASDPKKLFAISYFFARRSRTDWRISDPSPFIDFFLYPTVFVAEAGSLY